MAETELVSDRPFEVEWEGVAAAPPMRLVKPGEYLCSCVEIEPATANSTDAQGVSVVFQIDGGEYAGTQLPPYRIWGQGSNVKDKAKQIAVRDLKALGLKGFNDMANPPKPPTHKFNVVVVKDEDSPFGKVFCFNPA